MFTRRFVLIVAVVLPISIISFSGYRSYCVRCSEDNNSIELTGKDQAIILDLSSKLLQCNRYTNHKRIAGIVNEVRNSGIKSPNISAILSDMLPHQAEIYQNKDKWEVLRLRSYILLTLGEIGFPESAFPMLHDALDYIDERMKVVELGAAINVVGNLKTDGAIFGPQIIYAYNRIFSDEEFTLEKYEVEFSKEEATTVQIEIVKSLGIICNQKDDYAIQFLNLILKTPNNYGVDHRVLIEAKRSRDLILNRKSNNVLSNRIANFFPCKKENRQIALPNVLTDEKENSWIDLKERKEIINKNILLIDHAGLQGKLADLIDRPTLLTFFYTRCQNDRKCSATISHLAEIQGNLSKLSIDNKVRLVAITFEPHHDTPAILKRYTADRGINLGNGAMAIKLVGKGHQALIEELMIPVGYNSSWVNSHGIEAILLDSKKRIVRKYKLLSWNTEEILNDFTNLLKEDSRELKQP